VARLVWFAPDSLLEGARFEPSVPRERQTAFPSPPGLTLAAPALPGERSDESRGTEGSSLASSAASPSLAGTRLPRFENPGFGRPEWPIEEAFRGLQIGGPEPLGEGTINRRQEIARLANATLTASQSSEARGGPQLPRQSAPSARDIQGLAEWSSAAIVPA
jgi:hypothetical protein